MRECTYNIIIDVTGAIIDPDGHPVHYDGTTDLDAELKEARKNYESH